jgi:hypothetical protein
VSDHFTNACNIKGFDFLGENDTKNGPMCDLSLLRRRRVALAERCIYIGSNNDEQLWVRKIRKLNPSRHRATIISTDWQASPARVRLRK